MEAQGYQVTCPGLHSTLGFKPKSQATSLYKESWVSLSCKLCLYHIFFLSWGNFTPTFQPRNRRPFLWKYGPAQPNVGGLAPGRSRCLAGPSCSPDDTFEWIRKMCPSVWLQPLGPTTGQVDHGLDFSSYPYTLTPHLHSYSWYPHTHHPPWLGRKADVNSHAWGHRCLVTTGSISPPWGVDRASPPKCLSFGPCNLLFG